MIERPYRSGALQECLLCRQSDEIQEKVLKMVKNYTTKDIVEWLKTIGIVATVQQIQYYLRKKGATSKRGIIKPKGSYAEKVQTYIDELLKCEGKTYTLWSLNLRGSSWTVVTRALNAGGLIESMGGNPRTRWKILASKDVLRSWRDDELRKITDH